MAGRAALMHRAGTHAVARLSTAEDQLRIIEDNLGQLEKNCSGHSPTDRIDQSPPFSPEKGVYSDNRQRLITIINAFSDLGLIDGSQRMPPPSKYPAAAEALQKFLESHVKGYKPKANGVMTFADVQALRTWYDGAKETPTVSSRRLDAVAILVNSDVGTEQNAIAQRAREEAELLAVSAKKKHEVLGMFRRGHKSLPLAREASLRALPEGEQKWVAVQLNGKGFSDTDRLRLLESETQATREILQLKITNPKLVEKYFRTNLKAKGADAVAGREVWLMIGDTRLCSITAVESADRTKSNLDDALIGVFTIDTKKLDAIPKTRAYLEAYSRLDKGQRYHILDSINLPNSVLQEAMPPVAIVLEKAGPASPAAPSASRITPKFTAMEEQVVARILRSVNFARDPTGENYIMLYGAYEIVRFSATGNRAKNFREALAKVGDDKLGVPVHTNVANDVKSYRTLPPKSTDPSKLDQQHVVLFARGTLEKKLNAARILASPVAKAGREEAGIAGELELPPEESTKLDYISSRIIANSEFVISEDGNFYIMREPGKEEEILRFAVRGTDIVKRANFGVALASADTTYVANAQLRETIEDYKRWDYSSPKGDNPSKEQALERAQDALIVKLSSASKLVAPVAPPALAGEAAPAEMATARLGAATLVGFPEIHRTEDGLRIDINVRVGGRVLSLDDYVGSETRAGRKPAITAEYYYLQIAEVGGVEYILRSGGKSESDFVVAGIIDKSRNAVYEPANPRELSPEIRKDKAKNDIKITDLPGGRSAFLKTIVIRDRAVCEKLCTQAGSDFTSLTVAKKVDGFTFINE